MSVELISIPKPSDSNCLPTLNSCLEVCTASTNLFQDSGRRKSALFCFENVPETFEFISFFSENYQTSDSVEEISPDSELIIFSEIIFSVSANNVININQTLEEIVEEVADCMRAIERLCDYDITVYEEEDKWYINVEAKEVGTESNDLFPVVSDSITLTEVEGEESEVLDRYKTGIKIYKTGEEEPIYKSDLLSPFLGVDNDFGNETKFNITEVIKRCFSCYNIEEKGMGFIEGALQSFFVRYFDQHLLSGRPRRQTKLQDSEDFFVFGSEGHLDKNQCVCGNINSGYRLLTHYPEGMSILPNTVLNFVAYICALPNVQTEFSWCINILTTQGVVTCEFGPLIAQASQMPYLSICVKDLAEEKGLDCCNIISISATLKILSRGNPLFGSIACKPQTPENNCFCDFENELDFSSSGFWIYDGGTQGILLVGLNGLINQLTNQGVTDITSQITTVYLDSFASFTNSPASGPNQCYLIDQVDGKNIRVDFVIKGKRECKGRTAEIEITGQYLNPDIFSSSQGAFASNQVSCSVTNWEQVNSKNEFFRICINSNAPSFGASTLSIELLNTDLTVKDSILNQDQLEILICNSDPETVCLYKIKAEINGCDDLEFEGGFKYGGLCYASVDFDCAVIPVLSAQLTPCRQLSPCEITTSVLDEELTIDFSGVDSKISGLSGVSNLAYVSRLTCKNQNGQTLGVYVEYGLNPSFSGDSQNVYSLEVFIQFEIGDSIIRLELDGRKIIEFAQNISRVCALKCRDLCNGLTAISIIVYDRSCTSVPYSEETIEVAKQYSGTPYPYQPLTSTDIIELEEGLKCLYVKMTKSIPCYPEPIICEKKITLNCEKVELCDYEITFQVEATRDCQGTGNANIEVSNVFAIGNFTIQIKDFNTNVVLATGNQVDLSFANLVGDKFKVCVKDLLCESEQVVEVENPCTRPIGMTSLNIGEEFATIRWNGQQEISGPIVFCLEYKLATEEWTNAQTIDNIPNNPPNGLVTVSLSGLTCDKAYDYRVKAKCGQCESDWSDLGFVTDLCGDEESCPMVKPEFNQFYDEDGNPCIGILNASSFEGVCMGSQLTSLLDGISIFCADPSTAPEITSQALDKLIESGWVFIRCGNFILSTTSGGLFDISDPTNITQTPVSGNFYPLAYDCDGDYGFTVNSNFTVFQYSGVATGSVSALSSFFNFPNNYRNSDIYYDSSNDLIIVGGWDLANSSQGVLHLLDENNLTFTTVTLGLNDPVLKIYPLSSDCVLVQTLNGFYVVDYSNQASPSVSNFLANPNGQALGYAFEIIGNEIYLGGVSIDFSNKSNPTLSNSATLIPDNLCINSQGFAYDAFIDGSGMYSINEWDFSDPNNPVLSNTFSTTFPVIYSVVRQGDCFLIYGSAQNGPLGFYVYCPLVGPIYVEAKCGETTLSLQIFIDVSGGAVGNFEVQNLNGDVLCVYEGNVLQGADGIEPLECCGDQEQPCELPCAEEFKKIDLPILDAHDFMVEFLNNPANGDINYQLFKFEVDGQDFLNGTTPIINLPQGTSSVIDVSGELVLLELVEKLNALGFGWLIFLPPDSSNSFLIRRSINLLFPACQNFCIQIGYEGNPDYYMEWNQDFSDIYFSQNGVPTASGIFNNPNGYQYPNICETVQFNECEDFEAYYVPPEPLDCVLPCNGNFKSIDITFIDQHSWIITQLTANQPLSYSIQKLTVNGVDLLGGQIGLIDLTGQSADIINVGGDNIALNFITTFNDYVSGLGVPFIAMLPPMVGDGSMAPSYPLNSSVRILIPDCFTFCLEMTRGRTAYGTQTPSDYFTHQDQTQEWLCYGPNPFDCYSGTLGPYQGTGGTATFPYSYYHGYNDILYPSFGSCGDFENYINQ